MSQTTRLASKEIIPGIDSLTPHAEVTQAIYAWSNGHETHSMETGGNVRFFALKQRESLAK